MDEAAARKSQATLISGRPPGLALHTGGRRPAASHGPAAASRRGQVTCPVPTRSASTPLPLKIAPMFIPTVKPSFSERNFRQLLPPEIEPCSCMRGFSDPENRRKMLENAPLLLGEEGLGKPPVLWSPEMVRSVEALPITDMKFAFLCPSFTWLVAPVQPCDDSDCRLRGGCFPRTTTPPLAAAQSWAFWNPLAISLPPSGPWRSESDSCSPLTSFGFSLLGYMIDWQVVAKRSRMLFRKPKV